MTDTTYLVEPGVPIPAKRRGRPCKYPWAAMDIGDCLYVPDKRPDQISPAAASYARHHPPVKFTVRTGDEGGSFVWRIA